jgi:predicted ATPase
MIHLQPFDGEKARRFVMSRFASPEHAQPVVNAIIANGEGNPFYINEMLATLVDTGVCRTEGPERKLVPVRQITDALDVKAFPTLEGILSARLDALEPELRRILRIAAVLGRKFGKAALDAACGVDTKDALEVFVRKQLIRPLENEGRYSFTQSIMRDYCYATLPEEERVQAHRIQAETIRNSPGYKPAIDDVIIARHLELSGQRERAAYYYLRSAHHARRFGANANQEALSHYQKVLELEPGNLNRVFHARGDREWIWRNMGMRAEQFAEIQAMRQLAEEANNDKWRAEALCRELAYYQETGESEKVSQLYPEAKKLPSRQKVPFSKWRCCVFRRVPK